MTKLIVNTGTLSAGGAERVLSILSTPFADAFDEVQYVMWLDAKYPDIFYEIDPRVKIVRMSRECGSTNIFKQVYWYRKYMKRQKPSIVLSFMVMIDFTVSMALLGTGIPQVVAERNDPRFHDSIVPRWMINLLYHAHDIRGILMQTQNNKDFFTSKTLYNKTDVIYNPILLKPNQIGSALYAEKEDLIVSVARLTTQKKQNDLIQSFATFHKTHPTYKLCIYGEGEKRQELEKLRDDLNLHDSVILPGRNNNVIDAISTAKIFVMTSEYEGMSNSLLEALCVGLPCISTTVSGATDLIVDKVNGYLTNVGDVDAISNYMTMLADNEDLQIAIGAEAAKSYNLISSEVISDKWCKYLKSKI